MLPIWSLSCHLVLAYEAEVLAGGLQHLEQIVSDSGGFPQGFVAAYFGLDGKFLTRMGVPAEFDHS